MAPPATLDHRFPLVMVVTEKGVRGTTWTTSKYNETRIGVQEQSINYASHRKNCTMELNFHAKL